MTKIHGKYSWSRGRSYLKTSDIIKLIDYEGNFNIFSIGRDEPIGSQIVQVTTGTDGIVAGGRTEFSEFRFVEPAQEGRLFQFRPALFAVRRSDGRFIFPYVPGAPVAPPVFIPMGVSIQLQHPAGTYRWGTDIKRDVTVVTPGGVTIVTPGVGGVDGGFLEAPLCPFTSDPSELWDMFTIFGTTFEFRLVNRTDLFFPPGVTIGGGLPEDKDYFITVLGRKYTLLEVSEAVKEKVKKREIDYQPIVIGGVPTVTTRA